MSTVVSVVENYLKNKPFLLISISKGIINLTSLANMIIPEIEMSLKTEIHQGAVVMALKRISGRLNFEINFKAEKVLSNLGEIIVRSSLTDYNYEISETLLENQSKLVHEISLFKNLFYTSSRGVNEINIITSSKADLIVEKFLKYEKLLSKNQNLSSITVKLPTENKIVSGVYNNIFQSLAWEGVNVKEVISTSNEFTIIVNESQVDTAFRVIKNLRK